MLVPQVEEFRRENGGGKETQEEEAADGQILHILTAKGKTKTA